MRLQRQGEKECFLAACATLAGVPIEDVREYACLISGAGAWAELSGTPRFWPTAEQVARALGLGVIAEGAAKRWHWQPATEAAPDLSGRGVVYVRWERGGCHAMAFQEGVVYDPNGLVLPWAEWVLETPKLYVLCGRPVSFEVVRLPES